MNYREIRNRIGADPLFSAYVDVARTENIRDPSLHIHSGKVLTKTGRYTIISHCVVECLMYALADTPKTCWQLFLYLVRNISGRARNGREHLPKTYIEYKTTKIIKRANIKGVKSFYDAKKLLEERDMIYQDGTKLYINLFPLTWNIESESIKEKIEEIVMREVNKINQNGMAE
jgi:hypothetical protein